ncbi:MAG: hypothetical protein QCI00_07440 [Candidatus Thermoplasmatota archaeon]|nr:hypothetical protein [Candidatus Thermoplasmatota archaeon]
MKKIIALIAIIVILLSAMVVNIHAQDGGDNLDCNLGNKYAVIVVGRYAGRLRDIFPENFQRYYGWYLNSAGMMYAMLKDTYGYAEENIFLLVSLRERYDIPDSFDPEWIDYESNKDNLRKVLSRFKPGGDIWLKSEDSLVFTFINHGVDEDKTVTGKYAFTTYFGFPYEFSSLRDIISYYIFKQNLEEYRLYDWELGEYLENIYAGKMIFFYNRVTVVVLLMR